jgi:hypothetical protein
LETRHDRDFAAVENALQPLRVDREDPGAGVCGVGLHAGLRTGE